MTIPGSDILNLALSVITPNPFSYYRFVSRFAQPNGQQLALYASPSALRGSVQPVPRNLYEHMGLMFDRTYVNFFVSQNAIDVGRDVSGDMLYFQGQLYQCQSITPWYGIDGWVQILTVQVPNNPLINSIEIPADGDYATDDTLTFIATYNQIVNVTGTPHITLSALSGLIHGNALYVSGTGTNALVFAYTVQSNDTAVGIASASPIAGTIQGASGLPANSSYPIVSLSGVILNP